MTRGETRGGKSSRHTIQHMLTCGDTGGDKASGRRTNHPTKGNKKGYNVDKRGQICLEGELPKGNKNRYKERQDPPEG